MKLLTQELLDHFENHKGISGPPNNPIFLARFYDTISGQSWYVNTYDAETNICYGLLVGINKKWGHFSIHMLESLKSPHGESIQIDEYFDARTLELVERIESKGLATMKEGRLSELEKETDQSQDELER